MSTMGSVQLIEKTGYLVTTHSAYNISKAALNMAVAKFAAKFYKDGLIFVAINPGLVRTLPGGELSTN